MDDHHVSGDIAGGEDMRCRGAKLSVHLNVAALFGLDAGGGKVELRGVGDPADRDNANRCIDVVRSAIARVSQPGSGRGGVEAVDRPGVVEDLDPRPRECSADLGRDVFVLAHEDPRGGLEQRDP